MDKNKESIIWFSVILIGIIYFVFQFLIVETPKDELIQIYNLKNGDLIVSPSIINGKARGSWFFEASFPVKLYDEKGNLITTAIAQAQDDWMTEDFVPFVVTLEFNLPITKSGFIVFEKENPSGLLEYADELKIPIIFTEGLQAINLYYYNSDLDKDESGNVMCSRNGLVAVERKVNITETMLEDSIRLLLLGELTEQERSQGISTEFPLEEFSLKSSVLEDGVLTLEFNDPNNQTVGGSCRVNILKSQIEKTVEQFSGINEVHILPEELFQP